jgi:AraC-like DNA-binding protein
MSKTDPNKERWRRPVPDLKNCSVTVSPCRFLPLGSTWRFLRERGWFWRFYYNDAPGAGMIVSGKNVELVPEKYYLVPPGTAFTTWQRGNPRQFYMHFDAPPDWHKVKRELYTFGMTENIMNFILTIERELRPGPEYYTEKGGLLCVSLASLALSMIPGEDLRRGGPSEFVTAAMEKMRADPGRRTTVEEMAEDAGVGADVFIRAFRRHTGASPYNWLTMLRMEKAAALLESTEIPVDEITGLCGYSDRFHFSRLFKKKTGVTPAAHRRNLRPPPLRQYP